MWNALRSVIRFKPIEWSRRKRKLARAANIDDLRDMAKRRLPGGVFDYIDGGAEDEVSLQNNVSAFADVRFRPRVLRDVRHVDTTTRLLGREVAAPLVLAPTGFTRIADSRGELAVARSAGSAGIPYTLSTLSTRSIEEVAAVSSGDLWFQVYVWRDRALVADLLARAREAQYEAIVITVDTAVLGRRERDVRRGFTLPPKIGLSTVLDGALHPEWTLDLLQSEPITFANVAGHGGLDGTTAVSLSDYINAQFDPALSWNDIAWFRERWDGPIVLKGIQTIADARLAKDHGVDAIALSNHGGRQLDGSPAPVSLIRGAREAVGDELTIISDGGVRRGADIVKALALGADAVMVGRPYLYGLGAAGQEGVDHALKLLVDGMRRTMALIGCSSIHDIDEEFVRAESESR